MSDETAAKLEAEISRGIAVDAELLRQRQRADNLQAELDAVLLHDAEAVRMLNAAEADLTEVQRQNTSLKSSLQNWQRNYDTLASQYWEMCICNRGPDTDGPEEDCPLHGSEEYRPRAVAKRLQESEEAIQHLAAEAHRRKWAHENTSPAAFEELHRFGNELLDALRGPQKPQEPSKDDRFDEHGNLVRCWCGAELKAVEPNDWEVTKRCPQCAREYYL